METTPIAEKLRDLRMVRDVGVRFADEKGNLKRVSYGELIENGCKFAAALRRKNVHAGEAVILVLVNPEAAITAILGCMIAACPPTPIYPPQNLANIPNFLNFVDHVARRSSATFVVAESPSYGFLGNIPNRSPNVRGVEKFSNLFLNNERIDTPSCENPVAFLQFTSGSTSTPKGVQVMHTGLSSNLWMIREAAQMSRDSCVVTWLPVYHDMGLIGTVLNAITLPCELVVIPPTVFLKRPRIWMELITRFKGTHTAAPNFAYGLCVKRAPNVQGLDLGTMTTFICGAEPVIPTTIESFVRHYEPAGLPRGAIVPAYGLAEATLAVSFSPRMRGLLTDEVDLETLSSNRLARPVETDKPAVRISSCGLPMPGLSVRIAAESGEVLSEKKVGEIQVFGPTVTPGYIGDEEASRSLKTSDGWLHTGDLGYMTDGELYPCGRMKDIIIIRGRNYHAHDLESLASEVSGVRTGNVIAFSSTVLSGEALILVAETRAPKRASEIRREIRSHLAKCLGIVPDDVLIVRAGTLPKTSSGKLKRFETRNLYESQLLGVKPGKFDAYKEVVRSGVGFLKNRLTRN